MISSTLLSSREPQLEMTERTFAFFPAKWLRTTTPTDSLFNQAFSEFVNKFTKYSKVVKTLAEKNHISKNHLPLTIYEILYLLIDEQIQLYRLHIPEDEQIDVIYKEIKMILAKLRYENVKNSPEAARMNQLMEELTKKFKEAQLDLTQFKEPFEQLLKMTLSPNIGDLDIAAWFLDGVNCPPNHPITTTTYNLSVRSSFQALQATLELLKRELPVLSGHISEFIKYVSSAGPKQALSDNASEGSGVDRFLGVSEHYHPLRLEESLSTLNRLFQSITSNFSDKLVSDKNKLAYLAMAIKLLKEHCRDAFPDIEDLVNRHLETHITEKAILKTRNDEGIESVLLTIEPENFPVRTEILQKAQALHRYIDLCFINSLISLFKLIAPFHNQSTATDIFKEMHPDEVTRYLSQHESLAQHSAQKPPPLSKNQRKKIRTRSFGKLTPEVISARENLIHSLRIQSECREPNLLKQVQWQLRHLLEIEKRLESPVSPDSRLNLLGQMASSAAWALEQLYETGPGQEKTHNLKKLYKLTHNALDRWIEFPAAIDSLYGANMWTAYFFENEAIRSNFTIVDGEMPPILKAMVDLARNPDSMTTEQYHQLMKTTLLQVWEHLNSLEATPKQLTPTAPVVPSFNRDIIPELQFHIKDTARVIEGLVTRAPNATTQIYLKESHAHLHMLSSTLEGLKKSENPIAYTQNILRVLYLFQQSFDRTLHATIHQKKGTSNPACHNLDELAREAEVNIGRTGEDFRIASYKIRYPFKYPATGAVGHLVDQCCHYVENPTIDEGFQLRKFPNQLNSPQLFEEMHRLLITGLATYKTYLSQL